jgi:thymidylate kinase
MNGNHLSPSRDHRPDRAVVLAAAADAASRAGRWAWQGASGAAERWIHDTGPKDLDLWVDADLVRDGRFLGELNGARVAVARHPRRLQHVSLAFETATGPAVVDVTCGDLRVGPVLLVPAREIEIDPGAHRLTGIAAVADLLVRPVLRGRLPDPERLAEARAAWRDVDSPARNLFGRRLAGQLGTRITGDLFAALDGAPPHPTLHRRARLRLAARTLAPTNLPATWEQRGTVIPAGPATGPLGLRVRGVVVALVGTDGAGKSTVAERLDDRLRAYGLPTAPAYFGMAHGNLPGVTLARRVLGIPATQPTHAGTTHAGPTQTGPTRPGPTHAQPGPAQAEHRTAAGDGAHPVTTRTRLERPLLRRAGAWFYAAEYVWRYARTVAPQRSRRRVVIADRWVYDLRESPWPGSLASWVAERLVPAPDVLVLPDAPIDLIHTRKPERPRAEQEAQQQRYRRLLAEHPARYAEIVVDTSGDPSAEDPMTPLVNAVIEAAHGRRPVRR